MFSYNKVLWEGCSNLCSNFDFVDNKCRCASFQTAGSWNTADMTEMTDSANNKPKSILLGKSKRIMEEMEDLGISIIGPRGLSTFYILCWLISESQLFMLQERSLKGLTSREDLPEDWSRRRSSEPRRSPGNCTSWSSGMGATSPTSWLPRRPTSTFLR